MFRLFMIAGIGMLSAISVSASAQDSRTFTDSDGFVARETPGGYEPADPPIPANTPADARIIMRASPPPTVAFPPPAPRASYPACSGQRQDECQQRRQ